MTRADTDALGLSSQERAARAVAEGRFETQIIPVYVGGADETMEFSRLLLEEGIFVQGIRPPTVPAGSCRLRCTVMATHTMDDLSRAAETITKVGRKLQII